MGMRRIAIISDIHGNIPALEAVVHDIKSRQVDLIINLGDHISGPLWPKETIRFLMQQDWIQIAGNHDRNLVTMRPEEMNLSDRCAVQFLNNQEKKWLKLLPEALKQDELSMFHGTPDNNNVYLLEVVKDGCIRLASQLEIQQYLKDIDSRFVLCGHSHIPRVVEFQNAIIINPGSVGLQAYDDNTPEYHIMETGSPQARYAILSYDEKIHSVEIIAVTYDYLSAVKQAKKYSREDWAIGLQKGSLTR